MTPLQPSQIASRVIAFSCLYLGWFANLTSAQTIAINPLNTSTIYAATATGVQRSTNGGLTWEAANKGLPSAKITALVIDPAMPSILYVGTEFVANQGVFKSTDGGNNWVLASSGIPSSSLGVAALAVDPSRPATLYAGLFANSGLGLARSTNSAANWAGLTSAVLPRATFAGLAIDPRSPSTIYAASMNGGVLKSTDRGVTWADSSNGLPSARIHAVAINPSNPSILYARVRGAAVYKSIDGGANWAPANSGLADSIDVEGAVSALVVDPSNSSVVYTGTFSGGAFKTNDAGANWTALTSGLPPEAGGAIAIDPSNPSILYVGTPDGRVFKTTNGGGTWSSSENSAPCPQSVSPSRQAFSAAGATAVINIDASSGCVWSATSTADWVSITGATGGTGTGSLAYQVAANTGASRTGNINIGGITFSVEQASASITGLGFIGSMPHIAAQGVWTTTFTLVNKTTSPATARLRLFGDPTGELSLPLAFPQERPVQGPLLASSLDRTLSGNASLAILSAGPQTPPVQVGSAQLSATGAIDGFAIFHLIPGSQEAVVPLETRAAGSYLLVFDNTSGVVLGVAVQNVSASAATIPVIIHDDAGTVISPPGTTLSLQSSGHTSFVLSTQYPFTANKRGTIQFDTPPGGRISVLGIRTTPMNNTLTLTTIPAIANVGTNGGSIAHIATGNGWQTTFVLVNTGASDAQAQIKFFSTGTGAPLLLPLSFPQSGGGASTVASSVSKTLASAATFIVQSAAPLSDPAPTIGSAQLTTSGNVGGFVIFRYNPNGQEAVVPLESRTANSILIAFDNTSGTVTGIAVNSVSAQPASVPVIVRDDAGNQIATDTLSFAANGHLAFVLGVDKYPVTANKRGTIEFVTPANGQIGALGIRTPPTLTFTTLPALAK